MSEQLGLTEAVAMALGGMIGGGIYAVLGVVTQITEAATWAAFVLAGVVALCAGYSFVTLNRLSEGQGGSVTFVQSFTGNSTLAGMTGWTLLFGYVGSMAMYAFAFAEFALTLPGVPDHAGAVPLRPVVSVVAIGAFVGLNLLGARSTGLAETFLVVAKVGILVLFGLGGLAYGHLVSPRPVQYGFDRLATFGPFMAAGVSFVAFQGWQLLFYDQERIADPVETVRSAVYVSIPSAVVIYALVAVATYALAPEALQHHPHTALKDAAGQMLSTVGYAGVGALIISLSALFSTGSAINATLFSSGHFAKGMIHEDLLPDRVGDADADGVPRRTLLVLGAVTAAFSVSGSLEVITNFASVAFIVVFGATSYLAFRQRDRDGVSATLTGIGTAGATGVLPLMLYHLYRQSPETFGLVVVLAVVVVGVELLYFERGVLEEEIEQFDAL